MVNIFNIFKDFDWSKKHVFHEIFNTSFYEIIINDEHRYSSFRIND